MFYVTKATSRRLWGQEGGERVAKIRLKKLSHLSHNVFNIIAPEGCENPELFHIKFTHVGYG